MALSVNQGVNSFFKIPPNVDSIASDGELFNWRIVERDESTKPLSSVSNAEQLNGAKFAFQFGDQSLIFNSPIVTSPSSDFSKIKYVVRMIFGKIWL